MEKRIYEKPLMCLVVMDLKDVIATSNDTPGPGDQGGDRASKRRGSTPWDDQD
jgi:hypothetical protein